MRMASVDSYVWNYLARIRKCGLIQRDVSLGVSFEFSEAHTGPLCSLFAGNFWIRCEFEFSAIAPASCLPTMMFMG